MRFLFFVLSILFTMILFVFLTKEQTVNTVRINDGDIIEVDGKQYHCFEKKVL